MNRSLKPKLRFKGFSDDWKLVKLGDIVNIYDGTHQTPNYQDSGVMFLSVENIATLKSEKYISKEDFQKNYKIYPQKNDILMTRIGDIGTPNVVEDNTPKAYYVSLALLKYKNANPYFLKNAILSDFVKKGLWERSLITAIPMKINKDEIGKVKIILPYKNEQQKIGTFFSNLDNLITQQQHKLDKISNLKKAMLAKVFPKNGSDTPEVRFKGFSDNWEQNKVNNLCIIGTGKSNTQDKVDSGKYPFYVRSPIIERSNKYIFDEEAVITVGDGVGTGKVYHYVKGKYDLHQRCYRMTDFSGITGKYFFYYFSEHFYNRVMMMTAKTSVDSVRLEMIANMEIQMPKNLTEQNKIATYFNTLDTLITLYQSKLEKLKNIKKSCLEKMFV